VCRKCSGGSASRSVEQAHASSSIGGTVFFPDAFVNTVVAPRSSLLGGASDVEDLDAEGVDSQLADDLESQPGHHGALEARRSVQAWPLTAWNQLKSLYCVCRPVGRGALSQGGNTCYIAALLQCWFHSQAFVFWTLFRGCTCQTPACPSCLPAASCKATDEAGSILSLRTWNDCIIALGYEVGQQQDLGEFLKVLYQFWDRTAGVAANADCKDLFSSSAVRDVLCMRSPTR
jgi:hypothetical protein